MRSFANQKLCFAYSLQVLTLFLLKGEGNVLYFERKPAASRVIIVLRHFSHLQQLLTPMSSQQTLSVSYVSGQLAIASVFSTLDL